ncbi:MAG: hypothetical protein J6J35_04485 [Alphaproteobacteria bacterium]|nr:hypothetical protein [Alphaproteobacteria bacterium]
MNHEKVVRLPAQGGRENAGRLQADERLCAEAKRRQSTRSDQLCKVPCGAFFLYLEFSILSGGFEPWFESSLRLTSVKLAPSFRISNVSENGFILFLKHNKSFTFGQKTIPQIVFYPSARSDQLCKVPCGAFFYILNLVFYRVVSNRGSNQRFV